MSQYLDTSALVRANTMGIDITMDSVLIALVQLDGMMYQV